MPDLSVPIYSSYLILRVVQVYTLLSGGHIWRKNLYYTLLMYDIHMYVPASTLPTPLHLRTYKKWEGGSIEATYIRELMSPETRYCRHCYRKLSLYYILSLFLHSCLVLTRQSVSQSVCLSASAHIASY